MLIVCMPTQKANKSLISPTDSTFLSLKRRTSFVLSSRVCDLNFINTVAAFRKMYVCFLGSVKTLHVLPN